MEPLQWTTVQRKVNDLLPLEINPRKITAEKKQRLKDKLGKFNLVEIPVINADGTIIAGHQRVKILQDIDRGEELIDVRLPNRLLSTLEAKEYALISNTHEGEFDTEILKEHFAELDMADFDIEMPEPEIILEAEEDDYVPPAEIETDIVLGDLFEIGEHRLLCGDSTNADDVAKLMNGQKADMVFTDPPYNVSIKSLGSDSLWDKKTRKSKKQKNGISQIHDEFKMAPGEMSGEEFTSFLAAVFANLVLNSTDGSIHYLCMDWRHIKELVTAGEVYSELKNVCIWNKDNGGMGSFYRSKHELIFVYKNGAGKHINNFGLGATGRYRTNVWDYPIVSSFANPNRGEDKLHPTVKPTKLVGDAILDCSNDGNIVTDLFIGSGTTMVASQQLKRKCYGMELDPKYCQVIINRMMKLDPSIKIKRNGVDYIQATV